LTDDKIAGQKTGVAVASEHVGRRLAAIMAVDVAGYSRLMGEDEAGTARAVRDHREATRPFVTGRGGRIVKTMGDGVLLEFPSVVAAVEGAIAMQKLMAERNEGVPEAKRIVYRIGVNLGDVLIEGDDIIGDGVNIAARLESIAEPGGICLSGTVYEHVRDKIDATFIDLGEKDLKNIARRVKVYTIALSNYDTTPAQAGVHPDATLTAVGMDPGFRRGGENKLESVEKRGPPRLSMVVLPFANLGGDPEQEYFVDGVTESLTTDLSRIAGSFVIARNTAFTYKGKAVDLKRIGRELGVRYVLEGSVQRGGNRLRVNVQLIDSETGAHLWAERFDKPVADLFDMQDEIVARLANALNIQLVSAEAKRSERAANPDSMDLNFRGWALCNTSGNPTGLAQARKLFQQALALDSNNLAALSGLAFTVARIISQNLSRDPGELAREGIDAATKALALAPQYPMAHLSLGFIHTFTNHAREGIAACEHAIALDTNLAAAHATIGVAKAFDGRGEESEAHIVQALRLSPRDAHKATWCNFAGSGLFHIGRDEEAAAWYRRAIESDRNHSYAHFLLAAALAQQGKLAEARHETQIALALNPGFTVARTRAATVSDNAVFLKQRERFYDGLRKAGVPEG
jgi:TolB-like protein/class 3 adenylate cyclase